jgi:hypothetical protein
MNTIAEASGAKRNTRATKLLKQLLSERVQKVFPNIPAQQIASRLKAGERFFTVHMKSGSLFVETIRIKNTEMVRVSY